MYDNAAYDEGTGVVDNYNAQKGIRAPNIPAPVHTSDLHKRDLAGIEYGGDLDQGDQARVSKMFWKFVYYPVISLDALRERLSGKILVIPKMYYDFEEEDMEFLLKWQQNIYTNNYDKADFKHVIEWEFCFCLVWLYNTIEFGNNITKRLVTSSTAYAKLLKESPTINGLVEYENRNKKWVEKITLRLREAAREYGPLYTDAARSFVGVLRESFFPDRQMFAASLHEKWTLNNVFSLLIFSKVIPVLPIALSGDTLKHFTDIHTKNALEVVRQLRADELKWYFIKKDNQEAAKTVRNYIIHSIQEHYIILDPTGSVLPGSTIRKYT